MPALDPFGMKNINFVGPADNLAVVTPSNTEELPSVTREIRIGGAGTLRVTTYEDQVVTIPQSVVALGPISARVKKIWATGTTATDIVVLW